MSPATALCLAGDMRHTPAMYLFLIGAALGIVHVWVWLTYRKFEVVRPMTVVASSAVLGAFTYGTILYLFFG